MDKYYSNKEKEEIFVERTKRLYPYIWEYYEKTVAHEKMSKEELMAFNWEQRKEIVSYAYQYSPFYNTYYNSCGFHPNQLLEPSDWQKVPVVTKKMVCEFSEEMKVPGEAEKYGKLRNTSGSTGRSLFVLNDSRDAVPAIYWRVRGWRGNRFRGELFGQEGIIGVNEATVLRINKDSEKSCVNEVARQLYYPMETINLDVFKQNDDEMKHFVDQIKAIKPFYLNGNTGSVYDFALFCLRNSISFENIFKAVEVCGSVLLPFMRKNMEKVFNAPIYDKYGTIESLLIASECSQSGEEHYLHVFSDVKHIDIVDETMKILPVGQEGYTVLTSFRNRVSPVVKYCVGDRTHYIKKECGCGLPFPCIAPVKGRKSDTLKTRDGKDIFSNVFYLQFEDCLECVEIFQYMQHSDLSVTLKVKPNRKSANYEEKIMERFEYLQIFYKGQIDFKLELTDELQPVSGKYSIILHEE